MKQLALVIDADRCIGCRGGCQAACKMEHGISLGPSRSTLYTMGPEGEYPALRLYFLPVMCQQCGSPACAAVCPTGAAYKSGEDGVVYIDRARCIGCRACEAACPYRAAFFNHELRVMDKCDLCAARRARGEEPVCAANCSGGAIHWGDLNGGGSGVSRIVAQAGERAFALADFGNKPSGRFILRRAEWITTLPHEYRESVP